MVAFFSSSETFQKEISEVSLIKLHDMELKNINHLTTVKNERRGFPGGTVVENLPANAGDTGSSPGLGKIPHATEQLGP